MDIKEKLISRIQEGYWKSIDCNDGWNYILEELDAKLTYLDPDYNIGQVKEKFGTLRFYYGASPSKKGLVEDIMDDCVRQAEYWSARTCELCGACNGRNVNGIKWDSTIKLRGNGWYKTLCNDCAIKNNYPTDEEMGEFENDIA